MSSFAASSLAPLASLLLLSLLAPAAAWVSSVPSSYRDSGLGSISTSCRSAPGRASRIASPLRSETRGALRSRSCRRSCSALPQHMCAEGQGAQGTGDEQVVVGGGCFWCTEAVFLEAPGVLRVVSGYAGGKTENPSYREVVGGKTGHAECVQVTFDPSVISLAQVLDLHMASHDPTQLNRQGVDVGTQYRSVVLYSSEEQQAAAMEAVARAQAERAGSKFLGIFPSKAEVVTQVLPLAQFWPAESYHQDFYAKNPYDRYSMVNITPKLRSSKVQGKLREIKPAE